MRSGGVAFAAAAAAALRERMNQPATPTITTAMTTKTHAFDFEGPGAAGASTIWSSCMVIVAPVQRVAARVQWQG